jgi:hypothetical protein
VVPFIIIEILSEGTEAEDLGQTVRDIQQPPTKWYVYEQILQVPYYLVFSRDPNQLRLFHWQAGRYQMIASTEGSFWLPELQLGIGLWYGNYQGLTRYWLRWYDAQQQWIPTPMEQLEQENQRAEQESQRAEQESQRTEQANQRAEQESQRAEQANQRAEQESQRAQRLAAQLKALGIEPQ